MKTITSYDHHKSAEPIVDMKNRILKLEDGQSYLVQKLQGFRSDIILKTDNDYVLIDGYSSEHFIEHVK